MSALKSPSLLRLIGAVCYDWLIVIGLLILAGFVPVTLNHFLAGRDAIEGGVGALLFWLWNLAIIQLYFIGFWHSKRQTVGMRAWRLHIETTDGGAPDWRQGLIRFWSAVPAWGLALAGILWRYADPERRSWPDRASQTTLLYTPKPKKKG